MKDDIFEMLESDVKDWSDSKEIPAKSTYLHQLEKFNEEVGELNKELLLYHAGNSEQYKVCLELGDCLVTLINVLYLMNDNLTLTDCLRAAYNKISKRSGKLIDGKFVKSEDL